MGIKTFVVKTRFLIILLCLQAGAQLSTQEIPISFRYELNREALPMLVLPSVNTEELQKEDVKEEAQGIPPRFGFMHSVNLNMMDVGKAYYCQHRR
jgi:hypothetical protein